MRVKTSSRLLFHSQKPFSAGLRVWLDRQELRIGDSFHEKIDEGLANSRFGIVVLSPNFLAKGWPRKELDGLLAIEDAVGSKIILPVWHQIDKVILPNIHRFWRIG